MIPLPKSALLFLLPLATVLAVEPAAPSPAQCADPSCTTHRQLSAATPLMKAMEVPAALLPRLPAGVQELKFAEFFKLPVGPRGLEVSEKMTALDGRRVRVLGYMVLEKIDGHEGHGHTDSATPPMVPGRLMLAATPQVVNVAHYALAEDLPPQTLFVTVPGAEEKSLPYTSGPLLLTGTLRVGAHTEADGRTSIARLILDPLSHQNAQAKHNPANYQPNP